MSRSRYIDQKGRTRWVRNDEVGHTIKQLGDYLIIGGYPEAHAKRYAQLGHAISRWPECVDVLEDEGRLNTLPGVGGAIAGYLSEVIRTGTTEKFKDSQYGPPPPSSVLELTHIERLGAKTARSLYQDHGIDSMKSLCVALRAGQLDSIKGVGPKMIEAISALCAQQRH